MALRGHRYAVLGVGALALLVAVPAADLRADRAELVGTETESVDRAAKGAVTSPLESGSLDIAAPAREVIAPPPPTRSAANRSAGRTGGGSSGAGPAGGGSTGGGSGGGGSAGGGSGGSSGGSGGSGSGGGSGGGGGSAGGGAAPGGVVGQVLAIVNQERAAAGCGALRIDGALARAAQDHSEDMARNSFMSHTGSNGSSPFDRIRAAGYTGGGSQAENVAAGQADAADVMGSWMKSSGHRANILNCGYKDLGVGYATGGSYGRYWTQTFGG